MATLLGVGVMEIESMVGGGFGRCHGDGAGKQSCMHDTTPHVDMIDIETAMCRPDRRLAGLIWTMDLQVWLEKSSRFRSRLA